MASSSSTEVHSPQKESSKLEAEGDNQSQAPTILVVEVDGTEIEVQEAEVEDTAEPEAAPSASASTSTVPLPDRINDNSENTYSNKSETVRDFDKEFPKLFYVHKGEDCLRVITEFEIATNSQYKTRRESKGVLKDWHLSKYFVEDELKNTIRWRDKPIAKFELIPFDGIPFIILGKKTLSCIFGPPRASGEEIKKRKRGDTEPEKPKKFKRNTPPSRKINCPAEIKIREVHKFTEFRITSDTQHHRRTVARKIKAALRDNKSLGERRIYIMLPRQGDHIKHTLHCDEAWFTTDRQVIEKIYSLSYKRIFNIPLLEEKVYQYVKEELFHGREPPPLTNRRWFPTRNTIKNFNYHARLKMRKEGILVPLPKVVERTKKPGPAKGTKPGSKRKKVSKCYQRSPLMTSLTGPEGQDAAEMLLLLDTGREEEVMSLSASPKKDNRETAGRSDSFTSISDVGESLNQSGVTEEVIVAGSNSTENTPESNTATSTNSPEGQECLQLMKYVQSSAEKINNKDTLLQLKQSLMGMISALEDQLDEYQREAKNETDHEEKGPSVEGTKEESVQEQSVAEIRHVEVQIENSEVGEQQVFYLHYV